jgi:hypothetical protein
MQVNCTRSGLICGEMWEDIVQTKRISPPVERKVSFRDASSLGGFSGDASSIQFWAHGQAVSLLTGGLSCLSTFHLCPRFYPTLRAAPARSRAVPGLEWTTTFITARPPDHHLQDLRSCSVAPSSAHPPRKRTTPPASAKDQSDRRRTQKFVRPLFIGYIISVA